MRPEEVRKLKISPDCVSNPRSSYLWANDYTTKLPPGTHFCQRFSKPQGLVRPEELGKLKISSHFCLESAKFRIIG
jgi:hypothetical protein